VAKFWAQLAKLYLAKFLAQFVLRLPSLERSKCNNVICLYCINNKVLCKRSFPITQEDFEKYKSLQYSICQFEQCKHTGRLHIQGYGQLKERSRLNAIKKMFNNTSIHIEKAEGSYEEASNYCKAEFVQNKGTYGDLSEKNYKLYDGQKKRKRIEDPNRYFEFGIPIKHRRIFTEKEINKLKDEIQLDEFERMNYLNENEDSLTFDEILMNKNLRPRAWFNSPQNVKFIKEEREKIQKKLKGERFWRPITFYFYGEDGSGKTGLINKLFSGELYSKPDNQRSGKNYWNGYNGRDIVLLDEFYTKVTWSDMVNVLNDTCYNVESKYGGFQPFIAKYIFLTNTQPPHLAYRFGKIDADDDNKRDLKQFMRRLDYVIKFTGNWEEGTTQIKFEKGDEEAFRNMRWDLKYNKGFMSTVELIEKIKKINKDIDGEVIVDNEEVYWRQHFENYKIEYLKKYPYI